MEHNTISTEHTTTNFLLTALTGILGFISVNFEESLKSIDLMLSPVVKICSLVSFLVMVIINWDTLKKKYKQFKKK